MFATAIFFAAMLGILVLMSQNLRSAQLLRQASPHAGILAAELTGTLAAESAGTPTTFLEEGFESGDFGDLYPDFSWEREVILVGSNGFFQVDFIVFRRSTLDSAMSMLLFHPQSLQGGAPRR
jgi:hypothetical protein